MNHARPLPGAPGPSPTPEFVLTETEFSSIAAMVQADFGLYLQPSKKALVFSRLARRVRDLGLPSFSDYVAYVRSADGAAEKSTMLSALTTNVTQFFREGHHFDLLREEVLPPLMKLARAGQRVRLWSSACSAGQEPYSIAATLLALCPEVARLDVKILATDIDPVILAKARTGRYPVEELSAIPKSLRDLATRPVSGKLEFDIAPELKHLITFNIVNLVGDWPMKGAFDVIFCRNVAIYFDKPTQARLWNRLASALKPGGYLMIGHSERLSDTESKSFANVAITAYRKNQIGTAPTPDRPAKDD